MNGVHRSLIISDLGFIRIYIKIKNKSPQPFDRHQSWPSSMNLAVLKYPQCSCLHIKQTILLQLSGKKLSSGEDSEQTNKPGGAERQREKRGNSSVVLLPDEILCTRSVISFSSAKMDRISHISLSLSLSFFFSGMTASLKSPETPSSSVSHFSCFHRLLFAETL